MKKTLLLLSVLLLGAGSLAATTVKRAPTVKKVPITEKSKKKVMREKREDLFESLEEKVFRAPNTEKAKLQATDNAFDTGKKRMYYLNREEAEIRELESELGMEEVDHNFLGDKYDAVMDEFKNVKSEIEALQLENKKLKEYLARLNQMEARAKGGKR
jgi:predicted  nucleic acid-binding Zn-ribbon protein